MEDIQYHEEPKKEVKKRNFLKPWVILSVFLILTIISSIFVYYFQNIKNNKLISSKGFIEQITATPTPMAFAELTIPYLRQKEFKSTLNSQTQLSVNSNYRSYLTSYNSDGYRINALLTVPNSDMPIEGHPAIIFVHGYIPPTTYQTTGPQYSSYVDYLARNGFVVLKIDLRGHGSSEGEAGGGYFGSDYVIDTLNAYSALQSADFVNPSKIGLWGHSMAGNILLRSAVVKKDIPAVNIWGGAVFTYTDRLKYGINDNSYRPPTTQNETRRRRTELIQTHGDFSEESSFWMQVAPTNYLKDIKGAIQLDHAVNDETVNIGYSRDLAVLLAKNGVNYVLNEYPSGGHDIEGASFSQAMQNTVEFFNQYLK